MYLTFTDVSGIEAKQQELQSQLETMKVEHTKQAILVSDLKAELIKNHKLIVALDPRINEIMKERAAKQQ